MSIRTMFPFVGTVKRTCPICKYPILAKDDALTVHEQQCLGLLPKDEDAPAPTDEAGERQP
jgi:hypothetical protein